MHSERVHVSTFLLLPHKFVLMTQSDRSHNGSQMTRMSGVLCVLCVRHMQIRNLDRCQLTRAAQRLSDRVGLQLATIAMFTVRGINAISVTVNYSC
jgi:hypothetical protein